MGWGDEEWGYCNCQVNNKQMTKYTSAYDGDGLKCIADTDNGRNPCHFPFKHKGKVTVKLYKRSFIIFFYLSDFHFLYIV